MLEINRKLAANNYKGTGDDIDSLIEKAGKALSSIDSVSIKLIEDQYKSSGWF